MRDLAQFVAENKRCVFVFGRKCVKRIFKRMGKNIKKNATESVSKGEAMLQQSRLSKMV